MQSRVCGMLGIPMPVRVCAQAATRKARPCLFTRNSSGGRHHDRLPLDRLHRDGPAAAAGGLAAQAAPLVCDRHCQGMADAVRNAVNIRAVQLLLGHESLATTKVYLAPGKKGLYAGCTPKPPKFRRPEMRRSWPARRSGLAYFLSPPPHCLRAGLQSTAVRSQSIAPGSHCLQLPNTILRR